MLWKKLAIVAGGWTLLVAFAAPVDAQAQNWGDLEGTFKIVGPAPAPKAIAVGAGQAGCANFKLVDESLVVGRRDGIANIVIWLQPVAGAPAPPVHADVAKAAKAAVKFDNAQCRFEPRVGVVTLKQTLRIGNLDQVGHNVNAALFDNDAFNVLVPTAATVDKEFANPESRPMPVTCNIHPWMQGHLLIAPTPYAAVTNDRGSFEIENLPVGKWQFRVWHERAGFIDNATIKGAPVSWPKGAAAIEIVQGKNDLGEVMIPVGEF